VTPQHGQGSDVAVRGIVGGENVLFHFGQDVSDDLTVVVFGYPEELGPGEEVVEVVFHLVVFGKAPEVRHLHGH